MMEKSAVAARNREEILDAAERLLARGAPLNFSALAGEAGLSRPTIYAHFADRPRLLVGLLERSARQALAAIESAGPDQRPPVDALRRVIDASWAPLARHHEIARAVASEVSAEWAHADSAHAAHRDVMWHFERLVERGRSEGAFRDDLPTVWLVQAGLGLIHSAAGLVHAGQLGSEPARDALSTSITDLWVGSGRSLAVP